MLPWRIRFLFFSIDNKASLKNKQTMTYVFGILCLVLLYCIQNIFTFYNLSWEKLFCFFSQYCISFIFVSWSLTTSQNSSCPWNVSLLSFLTILIHYAVFWGGRVNYWIIICSQTTTLHCRGKVKETKTA